MKLRQYILNIEAIPLEEPLTVDDIVNGEAQSPGNVKTFFTILYMEESNEISQRKTRLTNSSAVDAVS